MVRTHQPGEEAFRATLPEEIVWKPFPAFPPSIRLAVIVGEPSKPGVYVVRVKVPGGEKLMPHRHCRPTTRKADSPVDRSLAGERRLQWRLGRHCRRSIVTQPPKKFGSQRTRGIRVTRIVSCSRTAKTPGGAIDPSVQLGREQVREFLKRKWAKELEYRLIKELWAYSGNRIAVRFAAYEWHDDSGHCYRSYGNETREFDESGFMTRRLASINDLPIKDVERKFLWPLGRRPDEHPAVSDLAM